MRFAGFATVLAVALTAFGMPATAEDWPTRPVTMIVTFAAGSGDDVLARILVPKMGEALGQTVIAEDIGGAGGMNGASRAARSAPDGYVILMGGTGTFAANQTLYTHPAYDAQKDFEPVGLAAEQPLILIARKDFPADDLQGFIKYAKEHKKALQFASGGAGSTTHLGCILLNSAAGISATHVPYRSTAIAVQDIMAGRIDYACAIASTALGQIKAGQVKAIAILTKKRSPIFPELKTADEQGLRGFEGFIWNGLFVPKGTPASVTQKLHAALDSALSDTVVQQRVRDVGGQVVSKDRRSPEYLRTFVDSEIAKWAEPIKAAGLKID